MDELSARLTALFRHFQATLEVDSAEDLLSREQYIDEVRSLVAEFGIDAIEAALDDPTRDDTPSIAPY
jgi:hypothetical protein